MRTAAALAALSSAITLSSCRDSGPNDVAPPPPTMVAVSELTQQAIVDHVVASAPTVRVADQAGRPVGGAVVVFSGANVMPQAETTSADGTAAISWKLATYAGTQAVVATLRTTARGVYGPTVTFTAIALPDKLMAIRPASGTSQLGFASAPAPEQPSVAAVDTFSNPIPGIEVTFEVAGREGTVATTKVITDANGRATAVGWILGPDVGDDTLMAVVPNLDPVTFIARVSPPFVAAAVASGAQHSCAIDQDGVAFCWGANDRGQVTGAVSPSWHVPQRVAIGPKLVSLAAGFAHTCGISNETPAQAYCWGDSSSGQLGGTASGRPWGPVQVAVGGGLTAVTSGNAHSCGLAPTGTAYCWGDDTWGQLGDGGTTGRGPAPVAGNLRFVALAAGASHTCGLTTNGQLACWGLDDHGQLGFDAPYDCFSYDDYYYYYGGSPVRCALTPQIVAGPPPFVAIAAGDGTCGLTANADVICLGPSSWSGVASPVRFRQLSAGGKCGVTTEDTAFCWAATFDSPRATMDHPATEGGGLAFLAAAIGQSHMCGLLAKDSSVVCWGNNDNGQLGNGTMSSSSAPLPVARPVNP